MDLPITRRQTQNMEFLLEGAGDRVGDWEGLKVEVGLGLIVGVVESMVTATDPAL